MEIVTGQTAVITGAASGIGKALAATLAGRGMNVVAADIEQESLEAVVRELRAGGATVEAVVTDVQSAESVAALGAAAIAAFGKVLEEAVDATARFGCGRLLCFSSQPPAFPVCRGWGGGAGVRLQGFHAR